MGIIGGGTGLSIRLFSLGVALCSLMVDQWSKVFFSERLQTTSIPVIDGFFDFELVHNHGAAFGMFGALPDVWREVVLIGIAALATLFIIWLLLDTDDLWNGSALGMVLGGAIGNLTDRIRFGWVVDFIHLHWHEWSWPVFNIADTTITVGIGMLLWDQVRRSWRQRHEERTNP
jgi:signal peptidase II